jgi:hypothetical protein
MKKIAFLGILLVGMMLVIGLGHPSRATAEVNINVGINVPPPPPLVIPAPPPVFVIPRTYVYFAPQVEVDIFFYQGYWYRPYRGHWYRSAIYNGKWVYIVPERVPRVLINLPPDFRRVPPGHRHIPYGHVKKNWKTWEKDKYWEKHGGKEWHGEKWEHDRDKGGGKGKHGK